MSNAAQPQLDAVSIVVLGSFNPAIFQPFWFSKNNLIRQEEAEKAKIEIVHPQAAVFATEWCAVQVTQTRFCIETADPTKSLPLRDLVSGTFAILEHTPIKAFGFNRGTHFQMRSEDDWHSFGDFFVPKQHWAEVMPDPGMRALVITNKKIPTDGIKDEIKIEPSLKIHPAVFIHVNRHYAPRESISVLLSTLKDQWCEFTTYSDRVTQHLFSKYPKVV